MYELWYRRCWRIVHLFGILALIIWAILSCSFSEPIDFHNSIIHRYEERERKEQEERDRLERLAEESRYQREQEEKEDR